MNENNLSVIFDTLVEEAFLRLQMLSKTIDLNVSVLYDQINKIKDSIPQELNKISKDYSDTNTGRKILINQLYEKSISEIKQVLNKVSCYTVYFESQQKCSNILKAINNEEISNEQIEQFSNEIIRCLSAIKMTNDVSDYESEKETIETMYKAAYETMNLQFIRNGESSVYEYCKNSQTDSIRLSKLISEEISDYGYSDKVKSKVSDLKLFSSKSFLLDKELLLSMINDKCDNKELEKASQQKLINRIKEIASKIEKNNKKINRYYEVKREEVERLRKKATRRNIDYKGLATGVILPTTILAGGLFGGAYLGTKTPHYLFDDNNSYQIEETQYDKNMAEIEKRMYYDNAIDDGIISESNTINKTYVIMHGPWKLSDNGEYFREILKYDVTGINAEKINQFLNSDIKNVASLCERSIEKKAGLNEDDLSNNEDYYYLKQDQNLNMSFSENKGFMVLYILSSMLISLVCYGLEIVLAFLYETFSSSDAPSIENLLPSEIIDKFRDVLYRSGGIYFDKNKWNDLVRTSKKINNLVNKINELSKENKELESEYKKLMANDTFTKIVDVCDEVSRIASAKTEEQNIPYAK